MKPDPKKVGVWDARAPAYDRLCRRWDIFPLLAGHLIDLLPEDLRGPVLDIGAGPGLASEILLARRPHCQAILIEPSEAMMNIARANLAGRPAQFLCMGLDDASARDLRAVAAIASASMQFLDLEPAFAALARVVEPGGYVAFNLWWHHWEETADLHGMAGWISVAEAACAQAHLPLVANDSAPPIPKTRTELVSASCRHGFRLVAEHRDEYPTPVGFGVDFRAMDQDWPVKGCAPEERAALLEKMHQLAQGKSETLVATRFLFRRNAQDR
jgi:SAM-dependent methyltransferase